MESDVMEHGGLIREKHVGRLLRERYHQVQVARMQHLSQQTQAMPPLQAAAHPSLIQAPVSQLAQLLVARQRQATALTLSAFPAQTGPRRKLRKWDVGKLSYGDSAIWLMRRAP